MKDKLKNIIKELIPYIIIIIVVVLIRTFIVTPVKVDGTSMVPTLENRQILLLKKYDHNYERFDIVVFKYGNDKLVKRIIGFPGDVVEYKDNKLYINNELVEENFKHKDTSDFRLKQIGYAVIPEDMYFVVGDNRSNSLDSRYIGLVNKKDIEGTVTFSIYPFKKVK